MDIIKTLKQERERVDAERAKACMLYDIQLAEIDAAIQAVMETRDPLESLVSQEGIKESLKELEQRRTQMPIDDAIVEAVKNKMRTPAQIYDFLDCELNVKTTINSVRTRLSRLKHNGKIAHDERGWIMPYEVTEGLALDENEPPKGGSETGEVGASPNPGMPIPPGHPGYSPTHTQRADPAPHSGEEGGE